MSEVSRLSGFSYLFVNVQLFVQREIIFLGQLHLPHQGKGQTERVESQPSSPSPRKRPRKHREERPILSVEEGKRCLLYEYLQILSCIIKLTLCFLIARY